MTASPNQHHVECFEPIINQDCTILFLGTAPGVDSLLKKEYYGHQGNWFWRVLTDAIKHKDDDIEKFEGPEYSAPDYSTRVQMALENGIAIWDVLAGCTRKGSADKDITNPIANDFEVFLKEYPKLERIVFTSKYAEKFYKELAKPSREIETRYARPIAKLNQYPELDE